MTWQLDQNVGDGINMIGVRTRATSKRVVSCPTVQFVRTIAADKAVDPRSAGKVVISRTAIEENCRPGR